MIELQKILSELSAPGVLATVVNVEGSAYRRPGARMFVRQDGEAIGTISGGCLEADVIERSWKLTEGNRPHLVRYDSRDSSVDDDWGFGLGCNGAVDVLLERIDPNHPPDYFQTIQSVWNDRQPRVIATVFSCSGQANVFIGQRWIIGDEGGDAPAAICEAAAEAIESERSIVRTVPLEPGAAQIFFEFLRPPPHLLVCGAGHDALPLVQLASSTGWVVSVCDRRESLATKARFPSAFAVLAASPEQMLGALSRPPDAAVVMTHRFPEDAKLLRELLRLPLLYCGVLGPRQRTERLLRTIGIDRPPAHLHGPVGLELGGETPEEIALAIIAEATAVLHHRAGGKLRDSNRPIHFDEPRLATRAAAWISK